MTPRWLGALGICSGVDLAQSQICERQSLQRPFDVILDTQTRFFAPVSSFLHLATFFSAALPHISPQVTTLAESPQNRPWWSGVVRHPQGPPTKVSAAPQPTQMGLNPAENAIRVGFGPEKWVNRCLFGVPTRAQKGQKQLFFLWSSNLQKIDLRQMPTA